MGSLARSHEFVDRMKRIPYQLHTVRVIGGGWTAGVGYEIPLTENLRLAPMVDYAAGSLGDVRNAITVEIGRCYSVVEFKVAIAWHFGTRN